MWLKECCGIFGPLIQQRTTCGIRTGCKSHHMYIYVTILLKVRLIWQVCRVGSWACLGDDPRIGEEDVARAGAGSGDSSPTSNRCECGACGFGIVSNAGSGSQSGPNDQHSGRVPGSSSCEFKHFDEQPTVCLTHKIFFHSTGLVKAALLSNCKAGCSIGCFAYETNNFFLLVVHAWR